MVLLGNKENITMEDELIPLVTEVSKEIAKDAYADLAHPVAKPTGETLGLIPRAVKAALLPVEKWVLGKEYNLEATKRILEQKLANTPEELIDSPEAYVAVPALQNISYCMDNDELRELYANLLASSMNKNVKNGVHPGFVEIIKQLCPDEAKIMKSFKSLNAVPTIDLRFVLKIRSFTEVLTDFSNIGEKSSCEYPYEIKRYFDNLIRLGLLEKSNMTTLTNKDLYNELKEHSIVKEKISHFEFIKSSLEQARNAGVSFPYELPQYDKYEFHEGYIQLTSYGQSFCNICID